MIAYQIIIYLQLQEYSLWLNLFLLATNPLLFHYLCSRYNYCSLFIWSIAWSFSVAEKVDRIYMFRGAILITLVADVCECNLTFWNTNLFWSEKMKLFPKHIIFLLLFWTAICITYNHINRITSITTHWNGNWIKYERCRRDWNNFDFTQ